MVYQGSVGADDVNVPTQNCHHVSYRYQGLWGGGSGGAPSSRFIFVESVTIFSPLLDYLMLSIRSVLLALCLTIFVSAQRCDNGPCALGCCNEEGWCGFGPDCEPATPPA